MSREQYVSRYSIPVVPDGHRLQVFSDIATYTIDITRTGPDWLNVNTSRDTWAVRYMSRTLARKRAGAKATDWEFEAIPSDRTEAWLKRARFTLDEAWALAWRYQPIELAELDFRYGARADAMATAEDLS